MSPYFYLIYNYSQSMTMERERNMGTQISENRFDLWDVLPERSDMFPYELGIIYFQKSEERWEYEAIFKNEEGTKNIASVLIVSPIVQIYGAPFSLTTKLVTLSGRDDLPEKITLKWVEALFGTLMGIEGIG